MQANSGQPGFGRRAHTIITNFQFSRQDANIGNWPGNSGLARMLLEEGEANRQAERSLLQADAKWLEQQLEGTHLTRKERDALRASLSQLQQLHKDDEGKGSYNTSKILEWLATIPETPEHRMLLAQHAKESGRHLQDTTPARYSCGDPHLATMKAMGAVAPEAMAQPLTGSGGGAKPSTLVSVLSGVAGLAGVSMLVAGAIVLNNRRKGGLGGSDSSGLALPPAVKEVGKRASSRVKQVAERVTAAASGAAGGEEAEYEEDEGAEGAASSGVEERSEGEEEERQSASTGSASGPSKRGRGAGRR